MSGYYRHDMPAWRLVSLRTYTHSCSTSSPSGEETTAPIEDAGDIGACGGSKRAHAGSHSSFYSCYHENCNVIFCHFGGNQGGRQCGNHSTFCTGIGTDTTNSSITITNTSNSPERNKLYPHTASPRRPRSSTSSTRAHHGPGAVYSCQGVLKWRWWAESCGEREQ
jgi:hypothetical protein